MLTGYKSKYYKNNLLVIFKGLKLKLLLRSSDCKYGELETYQKSLNRSGVYMYSVGVGSANQRELTVNFKLLFFPNAKIKVFFTLFWIA